MRENGWALSAILDSSGGHFHTAFRAAPCRVCRYARTHEALLVAWHCQLRQRCGPRPPRRPRLFRCPAQLRRLSCLRRRALPTFLWDLRFRPRQRRQAAVAAHPCHGQGCYRLKSFDPLVHRQSATPHTHTHTHIHIYTYTYTYAYTYTYIYTSVFANRYLVWF